ncbi:MAG TPA: hypothetical protein PJ982_01615 [Lacipirellulaceae bacterium]|nr:hypothetical protein [Lacipirellulaceae bacterium]
MGARHAIVVAVDGLRASALGAYGNTWHPTPALDALAARSTVVDWMWSAAVGQPHAPAVLWGSDPLGPRCQDPAVDAHLVTDDPAVARLAAAADFTTVELIDIAPMAPADDVAATGLAQLMAAGVEKLGHIDAEKPAALWIHARGMAGPWDAPLALRSAGLDEDDPPPTAEVAPPELPTTDPDEILRWRAAYAAETLVLDQCVGALLEALAEAPASQATLVALAGIRGYALGAHGVVGLTTAGLYSGLLHVPCLRSTPAAAPAPPRFAALANTTDLPATLAAWFAAPLDANPTGCDLLAAAVPRRQSLTVRRADGETALRTAEWQLRMAGVEGDAPAGGPEHAELYVKPDDRWEANDVARRCPEVVEELLAIATAPPAATRASS